MLVNRSKPDPIVTKNDRFSAVAMVRIKVPDRDPFTTNGKSVMRSDRNRVQITKSHRLRWSRVMARRTNQSKSFSTAECQID